jgi:hypothetical protein
MYRVLSFVLLMGAIALAPAIRAQDKGDEPKKADDTKKVEDKAKDDTKPPEKVETPKPPEKVAVSATPAPPPPPPHHDDRHWAAQYLGGESIAAVVQIVILGIIAVVLIGLRSDMNRLEDHLTKNSPPKT